MTNPTSATNINRANPCLSILHLSDLHRTSNPRLTNDGLISSIVSDAIRWDREGIPSPDIVVVSGDLIQGVCPDTPSPDDDIAAQYGEALVFLQHLAAELVSSDRSRVIIVPGNHDIDWCRSRSAMKPLSPCPSNIRIRAYEPTSNVRWNWEDQHAYEINNRNLYDSRFDHFRKFRTDFYHGLEPSPLVQTDDLVFVEFPSLDLVVVGFPSWHGNDCFCPVGNIELTSLNSSRQLIRDSHASVAVAVWHHNIVGGPLAHDYMDHGIVHRLIDFGFNVGLHGHQHYPGAAPFELRLPNLTSMVVVGAGSLAVGDRALPMGERRQFNILEIDTHNHSITVHVRAMSSSGVFSGSHRDDFGGNTFVKLDLSPTPLRANKHTVTKRLDQAMTAVAQGQFKLALELLDEIGSPHLQQKRQIAIRAYQGLQRWDELLDLLDPPQSVDEALMSISWLLDARKFDDSSRILGAASSLMTPQLFEELTMTIAARKLAS